MSYTHIIILITSITSYIAFRDPQWNQRFLFWPKRMDRPSQYYRFISSGFIHADLMHLVFNMLTLFFFGTAVEAWFAQTGIPGGYFLLLYLSGIVVSSIPSYIKHRNDVFYRSLGASGGVAAVLFSFVYFAPWELIFVMFIPIPGIIAGIAYLIYSAYMSRRGRDTINHDAHFWGAVYGFLFTLVISPYHGQLFWYQLIRPLSGGF